jgi:hypothetical protein
MRRRPYLILALPVVLAGCGDSALNPFGWLGGREAPEPVSPLALPEDPRPLVERVTSVTLDRTPGGAIVRAEGLPPALGYWSAALVPVDRDGRPDADGVLALEFRAVPPPEPLPGPPAARTLVTGYFLTEQRLRDVRVITVAGQANSASVRR